MPRSALPGDSSKASEGDYACLRPKLYTLLQHLPAKMFQKRELRFQPRRMTGALGDAHAAQILNNRLEQFLLFPFETRRRYMCAAGLPGIFKLRFEAVWICQLTGQKNAFGVLWSSRHFWALPLENLYREH